MNFVLGFSPRLNYKSFALKLVAGVPTLCTLRKVAFSSWLDRLQHG